MREWENMFNLINRFDFDNGSSMNVRITYQANDLKYFREIEEWVQCEEGFLLWWSDGVANEWEEFHPDLSACLARLAVLVKCAEDNFETSFVHSDKDFGRVASEFFSSCLD